MRNYHVVLSVGTERNIKADVIEITDHGVLQFFNATELVVAYAAGAWLMVEVERLDDKG